MAVLSAYLPDIPQKEIDIIEAYIGGFTEEQLRAFVASYRGQRKDAATALWMALVLGWFGGHYFYLGNTGRGWLYALTLGFFLVGNLVDLFRVHQLTVDANAGIARHLVGQMRRLG